MTPPPASPAVAPIRVMVVDDSALIRNLLTRALQADPEITVVATAANGQLAVETIVKQPVDVVVLDIEMPVMDGITALPKLLAAAPNASVLMASTLTLKNAEISFRALAAGASDYIPKPTATELGGADEFRRELIAKVRVLGRARPSAKAIARGLPAAAAAPRTAKPAVPPAKISLRTAARVQPRIIAVGSSTGGPKALMSLLAALPAAVVQPILITQHMPPTFTTVLAEHLGRSAKRPSFEAEDGMEVRPGAIYVARGGQHMVVEAKGTSTVVRLNTEAPENYVRPAVDPMLRSIARLYGPAVVCVILTGMGSDGALGAKAIADVGGTVVAQDEASSVVWGMPGATAAAGACSAVLPLDEIAPYLARLATGRGA